MESTVNDFLEEINEIIPLKKSNTETKNNQWKECFDSKSGFSYYWNTETNDVTWEKPKNFLGSTTINGPIPNLPDIKDKVKIYKIGAAQSLPKSNGNLSKVEVKKIPKYKRDHNDSEDEKITLITTYGSSSSSESEEDTEPVSKPSVKSDKYDEKEDDILSAVIKRAEELKNIGQADTKNLPKKTETIMECKTTKAISGFSLVAGYDSNSEEENEDDPSKAPQEIISKSPEPIQGHSTLFPIMKTPDISDFKGEENIPEKRENETMDKSFDMKNFKRKRRLGVNFVPTRNNLRPSSPKTLDSERKGLGFKENESSSEIPVIKQGNSLYSNFTKGQVEFVQKEARDDGKSEEEEVDEKKIAEVYEILREKLSFLCEGNKDVTPVQIILIQIETLYGALKAESLNPKYLQDWLEGTSEDLIKLEKEAAPEGWSLRWDRLEKRYYYQNEAGRTQWEFPQAEFERQEEAMDICTTPPPPDITEHEIVELKERLPSNRIPSPPPAPIISKSDSEVTPEPVSAPVISNIPTTSQPLPPGVDSTESISQDKRDIDSAFNSFYCELAEIEKTSTPSSPLNVIEHTEPIEKTEEVTEPVKKKRKKMKLGQGLSLKKNDVSKLVEKWKNVQNNY